MASAEHRSKALAGSPKRLIGRKLWMNYSKTLGCCQLCRSCIVVSHQYPHEWHPRLPKTLGCRRERPLEALTLTVAILAQGTSRAVAVTQAFFAQDRFPLPVRGNSSCLDHGSRKTITRARKQKHTHHTRRTQTPHAHRQAHPQAQRASRRAAQASTQANTQASTYVAPLQNVGLRAE